MGVGDIRKFIKMKVLYLKVIKYLKTHTHIIILHNNNKIFKFNK